MSVNVLCALCNFDDTALLLIEHGYNLVKCKQCGLIYLNPRPAPEEIGDIYTEDYYENPQFGHKHYEDNFKKYAEIFNEIFQNRLKQIQRYKSCGKLLEIGCAHGVLLNFLRNHNWDVYGIEISEASSSYARERFGLNIHTGTLESACYPSNTFDVVMMIDLIEHLPDPIATLQEVKRILKPDGILFVQVPHELTHWEKILEALVKRKKPGTVGPNAVPAHLYFFTPRTIQMTLEKAGFKVIRRESGNYGKVKSKYSPPKIKVASHIETFLRFIYFRCGVQRLLYSISTKLNMGNGINIFCRPSGKIA